MPNVEKKKKIIATTLIIVGKWAYKRTYFPVFGLAEAPKCVTKHGI